MSTNSIIIPVNEHLPHDKNKEFFLATVRKTAGFNKLNKVDQIPYMAGALMMFDLLAPYAQLRIDIEKDNTESVKETGNEHYRNLCEISRILKQYEGA